jgi:hypothetical protein
MFAAFVAEPISASGDPPVLATPLWLVGAVAGVAVLAYRYARRSGQLERQQTKWVVLGGGSTMAIAVVSPFLEPLFASPVPEPLRSTPYDALSVTLLTLVFLLVPISITLAALRYRLWDVDVFIKRTLVYGVLTALGSCTGSQSPSSNRSCARSSRGPTSQSSVPPWPWPRCSNHSATASSRKLTGASTGKRYDAVRTLEAFSARLRNEVDLDSLGAELLAVVGQTMQPQRLSLWFRPPAARRHVK